MGVFHPINGRIPLWRWLWPFSHSFPPSIFSMRGKKNFIHKQPNRRLNGGFILTEMGSIHPLTVPALILSFPPPPSCINGAECPQRPMEKARSGGCPGRGQVHAQAMPTPHRRATSSPPLQSCPFRTHSVQEDSAGSAFLPNSAALILSYVIQNGGGVSFSLRFPNWVAMCTH